ncbi:MAG: hypothetical protein V3V01_11265 [Acidimicrobiales bacterium]
MNNIRTATEGASTRVGIWDPDAELFALGLVTALIAVGHDAVVLNDPPAGSEVVDVVFWGPLSPPPRLDIPLVLLRAKPDAEAVRFAWRHGAAGVVAREAPSDAIHALVEAASRGCSVFPAQLADEIQRATASPPRELSLRDEILLRGAATMSISELADSMGLSRRQTQRLQSQLGHDLQLRDTKAMAVAAVAWGIVHLDSAPSSQIIPASAHATLLAGVAN